MFVPTQTHTHWPSVGTLVDRWWCHCLLLSNYQVHYPCNMSIMYCFSSHLCVCVCVCLFMWSFTKADAIYKVFLAIKHWPFCYAIPNLHLLIQRLLGSVFKAVFRSCKTDSIELMPPPEFGPLFGHMVSKSVTQSHEMIMHHRDKASMVHYESWLAILFGFMSECHIHFANVHMHSVLQTTRIIHSLY